MILEDIITNLERISDHCAKVGTCLLRVNTGADDSETMLDEMIVQNDQWFRDEYNRVKQKYILPERKEKVQVSEEAPQEIPQETPPQMIGG